MNYLSLFTGIGGFDHGLMLAGHTCAGYVEWDKYAHESFQLLHDPEGRLWNAYDIRSVTDESIRGLGGSTRGGIRMLVGGFPCQSFSIAGKREGFADATRGTLFFEIVRFASILRPQYLFLENVTGLLNHDKGQTFETVLGALDELGYVGEWQVHNSSAYVPQNRERIFIVASLRESGARKVFPFGIENGNSIKIVGQLAEGFRQTNEVLDPNGICTSLRTFQGGNLEPKVLVTKQYDQLYIREVVTCLDANYAKGLDNHQARTGVMEPIAVPTPDREEKRQNGRRFKEPGEPMFTLTAQDKHGVAIIQEGRGFNEGGLHEICPTITKNSWEHNNHLIQNYRIRKLTPLECFRLQSYPDWWYVELKLFRNPKLIELVDMNRNDITAQVLAIIQEHGIKEGMSDSQLYKMAGNGVTSAVAADIASRLECD